MEEGEKYLAADAKLRCRQMTKVINNSLIGVKPLSKEEKSQNDILKRFSELKTNQPKIINPGQSVNSKMQSFIEATYEKRKKDEESEDKTNYSMMNYEKYKPFEAQMIEKIKSTRAEVDYGIKKLVFQLLQKSKENISQCITNPSINLEINRKFMNKKGVSIIIDLSQNVYYTLDVFKNENTFTIDDIYSICSFSEIISPLIDGPADSSCFLMIYSVPWVSNIEVIGEASKRQPTLMRFINVKNPYTYSLKDIFSTISVFLGEVTKEVEPEMGFELNANQTEYLNFLPRALRDVILYSPLLLQLMKHKIEIEVNSNLLQRREMLFVFLMALEKDSLSSFLSNPGEEVIMTMMDQLLDLISNILRNLVTKSHKVEKNTKSYFGNFYFEKQVLVLTQNHNLKKTKEKRLNELMPEKGKRSNDPIAREILSKRQEYGKIGAPRYRKEKLKNVPSHRNTVSELVAS